MLAKKREAVQGLRRNLTTIASLARLGYREFIATWNVAVVIRAIAMADAAGIEDTILQLQAASLAPERWASVLNGVTRLIGGAGATLEMIDRRAGTHAMFASSAIPKIGELAYFDQYAALNPRIAADLTRPSGDIGYDYQILSEAEMDRSPFYAEFLALHDWRYFVSGILANRDDRFVVLSVQRSRGQGHVDAADIDRLRALMPQVRHAVDVTQRVAAMRGLMGALTDALDLQGDGIAVLDGGGNVFHLNATMAGVVSKGDGLRVRRNQVVFDDAMANRLYQRALSAIARSRDGASPPDALDFPAKRAGNELPYLIALRAISHENAAARALLIVKDPAARRAPQFDALRQFYGLTRAETDLAIALCKGISPGRYARERGVSTNTVYTHVRRLKQKCGQTRMVALIDLLNAMANLGAT